MKRECGGCTVCCTVMGVAEIQKAEYQPCQHAVAGKGCAVYEARPCASCGAFKCIWLAENERPEHVHELLKDKERPDQCGVLVTPSKNAKLAVLVLRESTPGSFEGWHGQQLIKRLSRKHLLALAHQDGRRTFLGPPFLVRQMMQLVERGMKP